MDADRDESPASKKARVFGHIPGVPVGAPFRSRRELVDSGVHGVIRRGIHGDKEEGAYSIILCGGYEDDEDWGDTIVYTGSGGQDTRGRQYKDQSMSTPENTALMITGKPVRVIRRADKGNIHAPPSGYKYHGLFRVDSFCRRNGLKGFKMCMFDLSKITEDSDAAPSQSSENAAGAEDGLLSPGEEEEEGIIMRGDAE